MLELVKYVFPTYHDLCKICKCYLEIVAIWKDKKLEENPVCLACNNDIIEVNTWASAHPNEYNTWLAQHRYGA